MKLRKHQRDFQQIIDGIIAGSGVKKILLSVTPGGGKSSIPIIAGKLIKAGIADALCWVVPRQALQDQGERVFLDPFFRKLFGHNLTMRSATNEINPCRGQNGFITTYQALGVDTELTVAREFSKKRYILILDEYHHVEKDGVWHKALKSIYEQAVFIILMTGTLERGDGKPVAFTPYRDGRPDFKNTTTAVVTYNRQDALAEKAILPVSFHMSDGIFEWETQSGDVKHVDSFSKVKKQDQDPALYTALNTNFAAQLLRESVLHWEKYKRENPGAKLLVVTADYKGAKAVTEMLSRGMRIFAKIATSHKPKQAVAAIKQFKSSGLDVLVTIAMAYEGLDVPPITHICCLTQIRSTPWIEQMIARAVRIDSAAGPYSSQLAHVFAPKDQKFLKIVHRIEHDQAASLRLQKKTATAAAGTGTGTGTGGNGIIPRNGVMTDIVITGQETETISEKEIRLRREICAHINRFAFDNRYKPQKINTELKHKMGAPRDQLDLPRLEFLLQYIREHYPIKRQYSTITKEISPPRARRKRVQTKVTPWTGSREYREQKIQIEKEQAAMERRRIFYDRSSFISMAEN